MKKSILTLVMLSLVILIQSQNLSKNKFLNESQRSHFELFTKVNDKIFKQIQSNQKLAQFSSMKLDSLYYVFNYDTTFGRFNKALFAYDNHGRTREIIWQYYDSSYQSWVNSAKYEFNFNSAGLISSKLSYFFSANIWVKRAYEEYFYNSSDSIIQYKEYDWNPNTSHVQLSYINDISYDNSGNKIMELGESWDFVHGDHNKFKSTFSYNTLNQLISKRYFYWNFSQSQWEFYYPNTDYSYDNAGNIDQILYFLQDTLQATYKETRTFTNNLMMKSQFFAWDTNLVNWVFQGENKNYFDQQSRLIGSTYRSKDYNGMINPIDSSSYIYGAQNQIQKQIYFKFDTANNQWNNQNMSYYKLDNQGNELEYYYCKWDTISSTWDSTLFRQKEFDTNYATVDIMAPTIVDDINYPSGLELEFNSPSMILTAKEYSNCFIMNDIYFLKADLHYFYTEMNPNFIENNENKNWIIYPNPCTDLLKISTKDGSILNNITFRLYNQLGELVISKSISCDENTALITLENLKNGLYLYSIINQDAYHFNGKLNVIK